MDQRERIGDLEEAIRTAIDGYLANVWTALPGIIQTFDPTKMTVTVQPAIKARVRSSTGNFSDVQLPVLLDVPLVFPSGGGFLLTFPIAQGDEVLVVFAQRCIDGWWQQGGIQVQAELRMHDPSDGFAIPGPRSLLKVPFAVDPVNVQLRSDDGLDFVEISPAHLIKVKSTAGIVDVEAPTINLTGSVNINGNVTVVGNVVAEEVTAGIIPLSIHRHTGVTTGGGITGTPVP